MNKEVIKAIDIKADKWILDHPTTLGQTISFDFTYLPNAWFKKTHKQILIESITLNKPSIETLNRYNYSLRRFFEFIHQHGIELNTYEDLNHQYTQMFLFELKQQDIANSTKNISMSALKWIIQFGQIFEYKGFPNHEVFDGEEYRAIKTEDVLKTKYITDHVMQQIEIALKKEQNLLIKSILEIGIDTGLRLSEVLDLKLGCLTEDL